MSRCLPALLIVFLVVALLSSGFEQGGPQRRFQPDLVSPAARGEIIVRLKPTFDQLPDEALSLLLGGQVTRRLPELASIGLRLQENESVPRALKRLSVQPMVAFAEPNHIIRDAAMPNDQLYSLQSTYLEGIEAVQAWDIQKGDPAVKVAVLDSGVDLTHPDLQQAIWQNPLEVAGNGIDDDGNGCIDDTNGCNFVSPGSADASCGPSGPAGEVDDDYGHGTFVAGIIAARANNVIGVAGAAPNVTVVPVKILDCIGGGTVLDAAAGLLYAARVGARVANVSFSTDGQSSTLASAVRQAHDVYGMVIVAATGNAGVAGVKFPAYLPQTIAVASAGVPGNEDARSAFSDWGPEVSVAAPGLNIISTVPSRFCSTHWLCVENQPYAVSSGTSFAAPFVSALAALLISQTPNLPPEAVRQIIVSTAERLPDNGTPNWAGAGRIRMGQALNKQRFYLGVPGVGAH